MTQDTSTNSTTRLPSIAAVTGYSLKALEVQITKNGIICFIQPLSNPVSLIYSDHIETKDLIPCTWNLPAHTNKLIFRTNLVHPLVYSDNKTSLVIDGLEHSIIQKGETIASVFQVFKN